MNKYLDELLRYISWRHIIATAFSYFILTVSLTISPFALCEPGAIHEVANRWSLDASILYKSMSINFDNIISTNSPVLHGTLLIALISIFIASFSRYITNKALLKIHKLCITNDSKIYIGVHDIYTEGLNSGNTELVDYIISSSTENTLHRGRFGSTSYMVIADICLTMAIVLVYGISKSNIDMVSILLFVLLWFTSCAISFRCYASAVLPKEAYIAGLRKQNFKSVLQVNK